MPRSGRCFVAILFICFLIITFSNSSDAGEQLLFDKAFTINNWYFHVSRHTFDADALGEGRLFISQNTPRKEIRRGIFVLNGTYTFLRDFLAGDELVFEKEVQLKTTNRLFVFLLGHPGAMVSIQINQIDKTTPAPKITAFTAEPSNIKKGKSSTLKWQTENTEFCEINPGNVRKESAGAMQVTPNQDTIYVLTAYGVGMPATAEVNVFIENSPPLAESQVIATDEDKQIAVTLSGTDIDGDTLSFEVISPPTNGTLAGSPPNLTYTPNQNYNGPDVFSFIANDGEADSEVATVAITVNSLNDAPVADSQTVNLNEDEFKQITLSASDVEGDSLAYEIVDGPAYGTLTGDAPNLIYAPRENYDQNDSFSFKANDGEFDSNPAIVSLNINPINDPPLANAGQDQNVFVADTVLLNGSASSDVDKDSLIFGWSFVTTPEGTTATLSDPSAVSPRFTPDIIGTYEVQLIVNDGTVDSSPDEVKIIALPRKTNVPDVIGMTQPVAEAAIRSASLVVGIITTEHSETVPAGSVISQNPVGGSSVVENTAVDLTISLGSENQPPAVSFSASPSSISQGGSAILTWSAIRGESAHIDNGIGSVSVEGTTDVSPGHTTTYTLTVTGPTGSANARVTVQVTGSPEPQPEGSYGENYDDLVPPDSTVEKYDPKRFSLITGLVHNFNQLPLQGVTITVHRHAEYGSVITDDQGRFSIPVEGGGTLTVVYEKKGLIPAQRKVHVPWNDNAIAETVVMITEDPVATTLTFDGNADTVVIHKSEDVIDDAGMRAVTMVFSGDNKAYLVDEQGNDVQELTTITARATEYPTPESMPARLPPTSAFTYCAELRVDGAERVRFEKPVMLYVDNFLGFPVGSIVPVGFYDRDKGVWVPSENGVVVELLDTDNNGEVDALDADGDGLRDDLDEDGVFSSEVKGLGDSQRYAPGVTFWRVQVNHFTPFDCNWPGGPPQDAIASNANGFPQADTQDGNGTDPKRHICSFVEEKSRIFHEDISISGTDMTLHYASSRVAGYKPGVITVPVSGETVPESLIRIDVLVDIAGKQYRVELPPSPNQIAEIEWDGHDHLGRSVTGAVVAHVRVGFVYYGVYYLPSPVGQAFGQPGVGTIEIQSREEIILWTDFAVPIIRGKGTIAEGWTLSRHHQVSPLDPSTIIKGDGTVNKNNAVIIDTFAGNGQAGFSDLDGPATEASIGYATNVETDAAGNLYIGTGEVLGFHWWDYRILKVDTNGIVTTAVNSMRDTNFAMDARGNFYDPFYKESCVFKIDSEGNSTRVAGICDVNLQGFSGDGGLATSARLNYPGGVDPDNDGNLYIADSSNHRIRKVDVNGIITTVAGSGPTGSNGGGFSGDGGLATEAELRYPGDVAVDKSGNLYIADGSVRVRKVDPSGIITTVAGNGTSLYAGDGVQATETGIYSIEKVEVDAAGNLYIVSVFANRVWKVDTAGIITTVAGSGPTNVGAFAGDGGPATGARLNWPYDVAIDAAGKIFIADNKNWRIRKVSPPTPGLIGVMSDSDIAFTEQSGIGYIMSSAGLHKKTIDLDTGVSFYEFNYDEENNLVAITDQFGNLIKIERDENGVPTAIVSPDGIRTELTIDTNNHLTH
ncbi:MAG: Ig-like domain-containing protein, partial [Desulfobacterales bacterium]